MALCIGLCGLGILLGEFGVVLIGTFLFLTFSFLQPIFDGETSTNGKGELSPGWYMLELTGPDKIYVETTSTHKAL